MRFNFFLTLASVMVLLLAEMKKADAQMTVAQPIQTKVETESGIRFFEGTWEEALVESKKTGKPIFMVVTPCGVCHVRCWQKTSLPVRRLGIILTSILLM